MRFPFAQTAQESEVNTALAEYLLNIVAPYEGVCNLNLGCGVAGVIHKPGWYNLDRTPGPGTDLVFDLDSCKEGRSVSFLPAIPEKRIICGGMLAESMDLVLASHVLEHLRNFIPVMREIHRVLRPGGHLVAITPHAGSDDAWEDPTHVRAFTDRSWGYFDQHMYEGQEGHGSYRSSVDFSFKVVRVDQVPQQWAYEEYGGSAEMIRQVSRFHRNIISEVIAVLRKEE